MKKYFVLFILVFSSICVARPEAIIFDCDGVLVDTEYMKYQAWRSVVLEHDQDFELEEYIPLVGNSSEYIADYILDAKKLPLDQQELIKQKNVNYKNSQSLGVPPIVPAIEYLNVLLNDKDDLNMVVAIVSSAPHDEIMQNLVQAGVEIDLLDGVFSGDDDLAHIKDPEGTNKPKPYIYQLAAEKLKINPKRTLVFEDTNAGVTAAVRADMMVLAVPNEYTQNHNFVEAMKQISFNEFSVQDLEQY